MRGINKAVLRCATQLTQIPAERSHRNFMDNLSRPLEGGAAGSAVAH